LVAAMKVSAGLYTEIVNIIVIVQSESVQDVVQNYVGFGIISDIDNMISDSIFQLDTDEILRAQIMYPVA
jgi:phosphatidate phosphatase APP1